jgi:two-component system LytT family sensor kinase
MESLKQNPWLKWFLIFLSWTAIGLAFGGQLYLTQSKIGHPITWQFAAQRALADWYVFALLSLPGLWLARRFRLERLSWPRNALVHLGASVSFSLLWMVLRAAIEQVQSRGTSAPASFAAAFKHALVATFFFNLLIYWVIISVSHAFDYYRRFHERELRTVELEKHLAQAKLQALQMQLNPHFLFNTLHAIAALMHKNVETADRMITRLSDLLRLALENTATQEVPLQQELDFLDRYLEIEQTRFGERLRVRREIAADTLQARVPNLILQPLVENAIRHGVEPNSKPGEIVLRACSENGTLRLEVEDNGIGFPAGSSPSEGVGLSNTRARLQQLYGAAHRFEFSRATNGGLIVRVQIPFSLKKETR